MSEIVVLSDVIEEEEVEKSLIFFTIPVKARVFYVKVKYPDGKADWGRYASRTGDPRYDLRSNLPAASIAKRRDFIQRKVSELSKLGYSVGGKYVSLFMSWKITELILTKHERPKRRSEGSNRNSRDDELNRVRVQIEKTRLAIEKRKLELLRDSGRKS